MRKFMISMALMSTVAVAAPAAAQYQGGYDDRRGGYDNGYQQGGRQFEQQFARIADRIQRNADRGQITRNEERNLLRQLDSLDRLHDRYARGGFNQWEHRDLQNRVQHLRQRIRWDRQDGGGWDDRGRDNQRWDEDRRGDRDDD